MVGAHRDDTGQHQSLEEAILENIDQAAVSAELPAKMALEKFLTIKRIVVAGTIFMIIFACTTTYALLKVNEVADENQQYLIDGCLSGNESRASELSFWLVLFTESAKDPVNQTKKALATRKIYLTKLYETYPQVDCSKVSKGKRVEILPTKPPELIH